MITVREGQRAGEEHLHNVCARRSVQMVTERWNLQPWLFIPLRVAVPVNYTIISVVFGHSVAKCKKNALPMLKKNRGNELSFLILKHIIHTRKVCKSPILDRLPTLPFGHSLIVFIK